MSNEPAEECERLRGKLAAAQAEIDALRQTLRTVAPEYLVTEADMEQVLSAPVPLDISPRLGHPLES